MHLLPLDDPRWKMYQGGYRVAFDCVPLIHQLQESGTSESFWSQVWDNLHHQGDVGEATYALIPYLAQHLTNADDIDPKIYSFASVVELLRRGSRSPPIPAELSAGYDWGIQQLLTAPLEKPMPAWNATLIQYYAAYLAAVKGNTILGNAYQEMDTGQARKFLADVFEDDDWLKHE